MFFRKKKEKRILVLVDWENFMLSLRAYPPEKFSLSHGFIKLMAWLKEIGEIFGFFVFAPIHIIQSNIDLLYKYDFIVVVCPKAFSETGGKINKTNDVLIKFGRMMIENIDGLTHLCLISGNKDFRPLVESAKENGLLVAIGADSVDSLSCDLIDLADVYPLSDRKMIHIFSPLRN